MAVPATHQEAGQERSDEEEGDRPAEDDGNVPGRPDEQLHNPPGRRAGSSEPSPDGGPDNGRASCGGLSWSCRGWLRPATNHDIPQNHPDHVAATLGGHQLPPFLGES